MIDAYRQKMSKKSEVKKIRTTFWSQLKFSYTEFCENSGVHAVRYLTGDNPLFRRIFFGILIVCMLGFGGYLVQMQIWDQEEKAIITALKTTAHPVWTVPFPAVIICNFNVVMKEFADNIASKLNGYNLNKHVFDDMTSNLSSLINADKLEDTSHYEEMNELLKTIYPIDKLMFKLAQPCSRMLKKCFWKSSPVKCLQIFRTIKTTQGFCCAFNHRGTFDNTELLETRPINHSYFVGGSGPALGLRVEVDLEEDQYKSSFKPVYGFNVAVQAPSDFPDMHLISYSLESSEELTLSVVPKLFESSKRIRSLRVNQRQCLFDEEGSLKWSDVYNFKVCVSECKAKAIFEHCNCWPYYYPVTESHRICNLIDVSCLNAHIYNYSTMDDDEEEEELGVGDKCNCLPQCNEVQYTLHSDRVTATQMQDYITNHSILNVYFGTMGCHKIEKDLYNTWDRLLSSIGGIVGFCIGGSIVTIIEIVYFFGQSILYTYLKKPKPKQNQVSIIQPNWYMNDIHQKGVIRKPFPIYNNQLLLAQPNLHQKC